MKRYFLLLMLFVNCAIWYPCDVVNLQIEKNEKLIHYDTTLLDTTNIVKDTKSLYYWKIKKCSCFNGLRDR